MNNKMEKEIFNIYVDDIIPNRFQPRLIFDESSLHELAESIRQHDFIQPLVLRKLGDKYEIIAGERRLKAANLLGLQKVPAIVIDLNDKESAEVAVVENLQRKDLNAIEEALSYKKLLDKGYLTQEQLALRMGKKQATISNKLRLLNLSERVQRALLKGEISERHARSLLSIQDKNEQEIMLEKIIEEKLTVRQTDEIIKGEEKKEIPLIKEQEEELSSFKEEELLINDLTKELEEQEMMNLNKIKETSEDINIEKEPANIHELLKDKKPSFEGNIKKEIPEIETPEEKIDFDSQNKFIKSLEDEETNMQMDDLNEEYEKTFFNPFESPQKEEKEIVLENIEKNEIIKEQVQEKKNPDFSLALKSIKENIENLTNMGIKLNVEEFDFEELYQIIIKINKK
ncbi:MAG: ParB/RepB/Spo0J family partition protein [Bacilli bacterium]